MSVGIDLGVRKITVANIATPAIYEIDLGKKSPDRPRGEELRQLQQWLTDIELLIRGPRMMESAIVAGVRNLQTTIAIAQTSGIVLASLAHVSECAVSSWKQATVGRGNATKDEVRSWVDREHPQLAAVCRNQDSYDAVCIALHGAELATSRQHLPA